MEYTPRRSMAGDKTVEVDAVIEERSNVICMKCRCPVPCICMSIGTFAEEIAASETPLDNGALAKLWQSVMREEN